MTKRFLNTRIYLFDIYKKNDIPQFVYRFYKPSLSTIRE